MLVTAEENSRQNQARRSKPRGDQFIIHPDICRRLSASLHPGHHLAATAQRGRKMLLQTTIELGEIMLWRSLLEVTVINGNKI